MQIRAEPSINPRLGCSDFNDAGPQQEAVDYDDLIENGAPHGERSEEFQRVVWHLASQGKSAEEIAEELAEHPNGIAEKYAGRLLAEVQRSYDKWQQERLAKALGGGSSNASPAAGTPGFVPYPQIRVVAGELPRVVIEAENALLARADEGIYQHGSRLVIPVELRYAVSNDREDRGWQLIEVSQPELVFVFSRVAQFWKFDGRIKDWKVIDPPEAVAKTYLARRGRWKLPALAGIVHAPFLRRDGSICETPGYDRVSGLIYMPEGETFPPIPQQPAKTDAEQALGKLEKLIDTFPFVGKADRSVALSAMLTMLDRRAMPHAPLHGFSSPTAGTGKSLLVDLCSILATGRLMPVITPGKTEEEMEKRLGAALLAGRTAVSFDNCNSNSVLGGEFLNQVLTQRQVEIRILRKSVIITAPTNNVMLFATGNNLTFGDDITRRVLRCVIDANVERPELREFTVEAHELARQQRIELVVAALTVLRAYYVTSEKVKLRPWGSFAQWSRRIREPLVWLGKADPFDTSDEIRESDPFRDQLVAVITQWEENLHTDSRHTVQEVIAEAINSPLFYTSLMAVAAKAGENSLSTDRLGRWLKRVEGKIVGNLSLRSCGKVHGYPMWSLQRG